MYLLVLKCVFVSDKICFSCRRYQWLVSSSSSNTMLIKLGPWFLSLYKELVFADSIAIGCTIHLGLPSLQKRILSHKGGQAGRCRLISVNLSQL